MHAVHLTTTPPDSTTNDVPQAVVTQHDFDQFLSGYESNFIERAYWIDREHIEGVIPKGLQGTLCRNGPGLFEIGGTPIPMPFDGDGRVSTFSFDGSSKVFFASRFVRTEGFVKEQSAGKMMYRGAFSVGNPSGGFFFNPLDFSVKGVANTGVLHWANKLLALYERDLPYELSPPDLKTKGPVDITGSGEPGGGLPYFGAHYRILNESDGSRRLIAFNAAEMGGVNSRINIWEFDEHYRMLHRTTRDIPEAAWGFFHDLVVSENYYILLENPIRLDIKDLLTKYMFGKACIAECLKFDDSKRTRIHIFPRPGRNNPSGPEQARVFTCPNPFFSFHHGNAFETEDNKLIIDTVGMHDGIDFGANFETGIRYYDNQEGRGTLTRLTLDLATSTVAQKKLLTRSVEFPSVSPKVVAKAHTHVYVVGSRYGECDGWGPPQVISKVTISEQNEASEIVYDPGRYSFAQEPIFVPCPNAQREDDGWVLVMEYNSLDKRSDLVILNAKDLSVQAKIKLPHALPYGLHGSWSDQYLGPVGDESVHVHYDIRNGVNNY